MDKPRAVSIMMGTGGMAVGFENAGIDVLGFLELNDWYGAPCRLNFEDKVHTTSAEEWDDLIERWDGVEVVFGNPPCQGLTGASKQASADHWKNRLFVQAVETAVRMNPRFIVMENIPRMLTMGAKHLHDATVIGDRHGYHLGIHRHRAGDFGVGQKRDRVLFVWEREPRWWPSHPKLQPATVREAISDLYEVPVDFEGEWVPYAGPPQSEYQARLRHEFDPRCLNVGGEGGTWNHAYIKVPEHHEQVPQGGSWLELPDEALTEKEQARRREGRIFNAAEIHRLHEDRVASTVTGMFNKMHPTQTRHISVREASRLMGFPDWWRWPTSWEFAQMAAGVCPPVCEWFARAIVHRLDGTPMEPPVGQLF